MAARTPAGSEIPSWYTELPAAPGFLYATGTADAGERETAVKRATQVAQAQLSATIGIEVEGTFESREAETADSFRSRHESEGRIAFGNRLHRFETAETRTQALRSGYRAFVLLRARLQPTSVASADPASLDPGWVRGAASVALAHITPEEARRKARDAAREDALAQVGVDVIGASAYRVSEESDGSESMLWEQFAHFTQATTRGRIVEEEVLVDGPELVGGQVRHRVEIRARVSLEAGEPDPGFQLDLELNESVFRSGEYMALELQATRDCYVTIFNLYANDSLSVLLPNPVLTDNRLVAGEVRRVPPEGARWRLPVQAVRPVGGESGGEQEALVAVATRADVPFDPAGAEERRGMIATGEALVAVNRWLGGIRADARTTAMVGYRVVGWR